MWKKVSPQYAKSEEETNLNYSYCQYKEQCDYAHHVDKDRVKIDDLEKEIKILRY